MRVKIIALTLSLVASTGAQAAQFDGPFLQLGVGAAQSRTAMDFTGWFHDSVQDTSAIAQLSGGYSQSFGNVNLAVSAYLNAGNQKAGSITQDYNTFERDTISNRLSNTWGLSLEPGFYVGNATLVYGKIGYSQTKGKWKFDRPGFNDSYSGHQRFHGAHIGAGVKHAFTENLYVFAEAQWTQYNRQDVEMTISTNGKTDTYTNKFKPRAMTGVVGVGYQF